MQQFSLLSSREICNNSLNTSLTKQQYSFMKTERFPKFQANCPQYYYNNSDVKTKRSASIGYGKKHDFTNTSNIVSPGPSLYESKSIFDTSKQNSKGKSFGLSREQTQENGHIVPGIQKNPGVGQYVIDRSLNKTSYTMRKKTLDKCTFIILSFYLETELFLSLLVQGSIINKKRLKKMSSGAPLIDRTSKRFQDAPYTPAPNQYNTYQQSGINDKATYILSRHRGQGTRAFSHDKRLTFTDRIAQERFAPGPGSYRQASDFGIYENHDQFRTFSNGFGEQKRKGDTFMQTK